jgi:hypothetical protein
MPFTKSLVGAVLIGGTLALALAPAAEATPPPPSSVTTAAQPHAGDDEVHASYTRRFTVTNLSSKRLQLLSVDGVRAEDSHSPIGTIVLSGQSTAFEVTWLFLDPHENKATFAVLDSNGARTGTATATMRIYDEWLAPKSRSSATVTGGGTALANGYQITFLDAPGTTVDLPNTDPVAQGAALSSLCANSAVRCSFTATQPPEKILGPRHVVGKPVNNLTSRDQETTIGGTDTVEMSHSVEISASATVKVLEAVELNITATYGFGLSVSHEFTQSTSITIAPMTRAWLEAQEPVIRTTGDFTITAGNTTWTIRGVQFLTPDPDDTRHGEQFIRDQRLSDQGDGVGPVTTYKVSDAGVAQIAATR